MTPSIQTVSIYGVGQFGYAMLRHLSRKADPPTTLRCYDASDEVRASLRERREHPLWEAPKPMPEFVQVASSPEHLLDGADVLILAVNSDATRDVLPTLATHLKGAPTVVNTAKALDSQTGETLESLISSSLRDAGVEHLYAAISGGAIAKELLRGQPLGATLACRHAQGLPLLRDLFGSDGLWVETSDDLTGVQLAGAFKNVISICAGMAEGMGFAYGVETHLISRLAGEIGDFCVESLGASPSTFSISSQCWGNDMWMSCTGPTRNRELGRLIGGGMTLAEGVEEMTRRRKTVEGVATIRAMAPLFERFPDQLPLLRVARRVMLEHRPPDVLFQALTQAR